MSSKKKKKPSYSKEDIAKAVYDVKEKLLTYAQASSKYGVPTSSIRDKIIDRYAVDKDVPGPAPALTSSQERRLVAYVKHMANVGYGKTKKEIPLIIKKILDEAEVNHPKFNDNLPSTGWVYRFLNRHPELTCRIPEHLGMLRSKITEDDIREWFMGLSSYLTNEGLDPKTFLSTENADRIFNCDETGFPLAGTGAKLRIITEKGNKNVYSIGPETKEQITVLGCASASGTLLKPYVIFKGERPRFKFHDIDPNEFYVGRSPNGWISAEGFFEWVANYFYESIKNQVTFPVLLFVDGHSSHLNLAVSEFCLEKKILLFCFPPHASHVIQPLDLSVYGPMKTYWNEELKLYAIQNPERQMSKESFFPVFKKAWDRSNKPANIISGFRKAGLVPFNPNALDYSKVSSSKTTKPILVQNRNSFAEIYAYEKCFRSVERRLPRDLLKKFERRFNEGYDVIGNTCEEYLWQIYYDIKSLQLDKHQSELINLAPSAASTSSFALDSPETSANTHAFVSPREAKAHDDVAAATSSCTFAPASPKTGMNAIALASPSTSISPSMINREVITITDMDQITYEVNDITSNEEIKSLLDDIIDSIVSQTENGEQNQPSTSGVDNQVSPKTTSKRKLEFQNWDESPFKKYLKFPEELIQRKKTTRKNKLPFLISGSESVEYMRKKLEKKQEAERLKIERKIERERKKNEKKVTGKKKSKKTPRYQSSSESDGENCADESEEICKECESNEGDFEDWIGCSNCPYWFHKHCINIDVSAMNDAEISNLEWHCKFCEMSST